MADEFDANSIVAKYFAEHTDRVVSSVGTAIGYYSPRVLRSLRSNPYREYLERLISDHCAVKTFFQRDSPTPIGNFYVPASLALGRTELKETGLQSIDRQGRDAVVVGIAGSGKSVFMRHLALDAVRRSNRIPVFFELRSLNRSSMTLEEALTNTVVEQGLAIDPDDAKAIFSRGRVALLLDGLDEIEPSTFDAHSRMISKLSRKWPGCRVVVSSRPDHSVTAWQSFNCYQIQPLSKNDACRLIRKLPAAEDLKGRFVRDLNSGLYESHTSFCSNPLCLSIMLLTYKDNAAIPKNKAAFFDRAYEALFQKHDALKEDFTRVRQTDLDMNQFAAVFSAFCLTTLIAKKISFPETVAIQELERARTTVRINFSAHDFLQDLKRATCLMIDDGLDITFTHRALQEHFAAKFIAASSDERAQKLVNAFASRMFQDNVLNNLFEINREQLERLYILPHLTTLANILDGASWDTPAPVQKLCESCNVTLMSYRARNVQIVLGRAPDRNSGDFFNVLFTVLQWYKSRDLIEDADGPMNDSALLDYMRQQNLDRINLYELEPEHEIFSILDENFYFVSRRFLRTLLNIKSTIEREVAKADATIDELLSEAPPNSA